MTPADRRDVAAVERHARELLRHCELLRARDLQHRNPRERARLGVIALEAWRAWRAAARADRRYVRDSGRDWQIKWRLPRGYDR